MTAFAYRATYTHPLFGGEHHVVDHGVVDTEDADAAIAHVASRSSIAACKAGMKIEVVEVDWTYAYTKHAKYDGDWRDAATVLRITEEAPA